MDIKTLTDEQKSVMLAKLCGWVVTNGFDGIIISSSTEVFQITLTSPNYLYNRKWMFIAWLVLNWAMQQKIAVYDNVNFRDLLSDYLIDVKDFGAFGLPPADAQRAWLDKILELAIEAQNKTFDPAFVINRTSKQKKDAESNSNNEPTKNKYERFAERNGITLANTQSNPVDTGSIQEFN